MLPANQDQEHPRTAMPAPLDPVIEKIIPLLPLRDPTVMTPSSAR
jgi:acetyl esterase